MKNLKNRFVKGKPFLAFVLIVGLGSCADLTETVYDEVPKSEYDKTLTSPTEAQLRDGLNSIYTNMSPIAGHGNLFSIQEVSTDEMIIPQRGGDWYDGGQWIRMHRHVYQPTEEAFNNVWRLMYSGIVTCNRILVQSKQLNPTLAAQLEPELRAVRALYYFWLCDLFGNVPIATKWATNITTVIGDEIKTRTRADVYAFVESELTAALPNLTKDVATSYGKMNYWAAKALLAKLYLNAQVYKGAPEWAKCAAACSEIIASGKYRLEPNFFHNFDATNDDSRENMFVIPYQAGRLDGFNLAQMTLHYASKETYNLQDQPWNGYCSSAEFYNSFDTSDVRRASLLAGQQRTASGAILEDSGAESKDPDGKPVNFTPQLNELYPNCLRQAGVRVGKYPFASGAKPSLDNDFPLLRYADVLLMQAEALWRQSNTDPAAIALVNQIRTRANMRPYTTLTSDEFLKELGREKFAEAWRRNDMIRFGKYFQAYGLKTGTDQPCKGIFPIPTPQINANTSLVQNDCYK